MSANPAAPRHVAVVMDGNGRWAGKRMLPRFVGHKQGMDNLVRAIDIFARRGVEYLTVFAFSSENWKRPADEVSGLMNLVPVGVGKYLDKLHRDGVRVRVIGDRDRLAPSLREAWDRAEALTQHNQKINLSVAFNYGGRWDMLQAARRALADGIPPHSLDEDSLTRRMALGFAPDPDLFIRTGGEMRISNFLLWQAAYAELYFTDCLWPDFDEAQIDKALTAFARRDRRFGGVDGGVDGAPVASGSAQAAQA